MTEKPKDRPTSSEAGADPLRQSGLSRTWIALSVFALLLALIADFVLQNTNSVRLSFLFWHTHLPLAVALLIAVAGGIAITSLAGTVRILQLRRRVRQDRKRR